jgi:hypothetical protein
MRGLSRGLRLDWFWNHVTILSLVRIPRNRIFPADVAAILFEVPILEQNFRPRVERGGQPLILK